MQLFLCETESMQENFKYEKPQQIDIIENAEDGKGKRSTSTSEQQRKHSRTHQNRSFSVFVHLLCQPKNRGSKMKKKNKKKKRRRRVGKWKLTKGPFIKIAALMCSSTFSAKQRTQKRNGKKQKEKTQNTGGQMKRCRVKNRIFRCNKNTEDGEGNENLRRFRLCVYAATVKES